MVEASVLRASTSACHFFETWLSCSLARSSDLRGYSLVLDRASDAGIIFGSPKIDISNEVLQKLGYSN